MVSFCKLAGCCRVPFLMSTTCCTWTGEGLGKFGQRFEDDSDAAGSFCLLHLSFAASCLSALNLWLAFLTDECQLSWSGASCCHDWWPIPARESCLFSWSSKRFLGAPHSCFLSWSSPKGTALGMSMSFILVVWPAKCSCTWSKMDPLLGRQALLRTSSSDTVLPLDAKGGMQGALVKPLE